MKRFLLSAAVVAAAACTATKQEPTLKDAFKDNFTIGAAINEWQIRGLDTLGVQTLTKHFNSIVAENCMKHEELHLVSVHHFF